MLGPCITHPAQDKRASALNCAFTAYSGVSFSCLHCNGSLTSCRDVLPAEPAAVPAPSQVPLPQVSPKEPSTVSASSLLRLCFPLRGQLLPGPPQAPQVPPLPAPELRLLQW
ncbi:hypothetical protein AB1E18_002507 [Capra hircus]